MISRSRVAVLAGALLLPVIALGIWREIVTQDDTRNKFGLMLEEWGYLELVPPSRLFGPGTINTVEKLPNGLLKLHPTCTMDKEVLTAMWLGSTTVDRNFAESVANTFTGSAKAADLVKSGAAGEQIKQISVSLRDMRVITMSHEDLIKLRGMYLKGTCEEAVVLNLRSGARVCQIVEVLQMDVAYSVHFAVGLESMEKLTLAEQTAASFDLTVDESLTDVLRGDDLYYGVKLRKLSCFEGNTDRSPLASIRTDVAVR